MCVQTFVVSCYPPFKTSQTPQREKGGRSYNIFLVLSFIVMQSSFATSCPFFSLYLIFFYSFVVTTLQLKRKELEVLYSNYGLVLFHFFPCLIWVFHEAFDVFNGRERLKGYFCVITICLEGHCSQMNWKENFD